MYNKKFRSELCHFLHLVIMLKGGQTPWPVVSVCNDCVSLFQAPSKPQCQQSDVTG